MASLSAFPFVKIVYTTVLLGLIAFLVREIYSLWWDRSLYVGQFQYFIDGKADDAQAKAFPAHILGQHQLLRSALIEETDRRAQERRINAPATAEVFRGLPSSLPEIARWQTVLSDVELKIQGFDLGKLLSQLRTSISPPDEINGFVEKTGSTVRASVNWPNRRMKNGAVLHTPFETGQLAAEPSAALAIAASIVWAQAAEADAEFAKIPREVFVAWALTWWDYRQIRGREALGQLPSDDDKKRWTQARRLVDKLTSQAEKYPEIWRLRADIIEAAPDGQVTPDDQKVAREDRQRYAVVLGLARPSAIASPETVVVRPGAAVWGRASGNIKDSQFSFSVTATLITVDRSGNRRIVLPAYALVEGSSDKETEYALSPAGPVVARARKSDLVYPSTAGENGVVLASLEANIASSNALTKSIHLSNVVGVPPVGAALTLFSPRKGAVTGVIKGVDGLFALTEGRITEAGDAGAPVVDADGHLFAMGYIGNSEESRLLSLKWMFEQAGLTLAP